MVSTPLLHPPHPIQFSLFTVPCCSSQIEVAQHSLPSTSQTVFCCSNLPLCGPSCLPCLTSCSHIKGSINWRQDSPGTYCSARIKAVLEPCCTNEESSQCHSVLGQALPVTDTSCSQLLRPRALEKLRMFPNCTRKCSHMEWAQPRWAFVVSKVGIVCGVVRWGLSTSEDNKQKGKHQHLGKNGWNGEGGRGFQGQKE